MTGRRASHQPPDARPVGWLLPRRSGGFTARPQLRPQLAVLPHTQPYHVLPASPAAGCAAFHPALPQDALHFVHRVEVPVKLLGGCLWVRVSAHVYNTPDDYERLADAVLAVAGDN
jgi:selenocysteine lyase/cysteine desulfurase